ncbi:MAG TPA: vitamin K epoxide reductase family protein [Candidatus Nanoarchaeia archaeon]|nr:vitamin K epoxide reductase family protein [Candidatus Nanoarchaeia archaeon]
MILTLALTGLLLSIYAFYVKIKVKIDKTYRPLCDLKKNISCTKAFSSKYGSIAKLPNPLYGILFYLTISGLWFFELKRVIEILSTMAFAITIYLAYLSYFKQKNFCLVCNGIYVVNTFLFFLSL